MYLTSRKRTNSFVVSSMFSDVKPIPPQPKQGPEKPPKPLFLCATSICGFFWSCLRNYIALKVPFLLGNLSAANTFGVKTLTKISVIRLLSMLRESPKTLGLTSFSR